MERIFVTGLAALVCLGFVAVANADEIIFQHGPERIVRDTQTGEYIIEYIGDGGTLKVVRWTPASNVKASVRSKFKQSDDRIKYRYTIKNHKNSLQPAIAFEMLVSHGVKKENMSAPEKWNADLVKNYDDPSLGIWAHWGANRVAFGLPPGGSLTGLEMVSEELPGVGTALIRGLMSVLTYPDEGPGGTLIEFMEQGGFLRKASEGVLLPAAVPRIPVPTPFDAAAVLASLQKHVKEDLVSMALIDPVLVSKLDPLFVAAIDAAQRGNAEGARKAIKDIRHLLKREHEDVDKEDDKDEDDDQDDKKPQNKRLIDKLAAKVLDFDLKYVEKRVKGSLD